MNNMYNLSLIVSSYVSVFILGYIVAQLNNIVMRTINKDRGDGLGESVSNETYKTSLELLNKPSTLPPHLQAPLRAPSENIPTPKPIEINERLFITDIKNDTLEKKYETDLGETTSQADSNFSASVSKLTSFKQKKDS